MLRVQLSCEFFLSLRHYILSRRPPEKAPETPLFAGGKDVFGRPPACRVCHHMLNFINMKLLPEVRRGAVCKLNISARPRVLKALGFNSLKVHFFQAAGFKSTQPAPLHRAGGAPEERGPAQAGQRLSLPVRAVVATCRVV